MKAIFTIGALVGIAWGGWELGGMLSGDAISMALGVIFGMMAGIPVALIALAATRERNISVNVHHHHASETPKQPVGMIPANPERYIVLDNSVKPQRITVNEVSR